MNWRAVFSPALAVALLAMGGAAAGMKTAMEVMHVVLQKKAIYAENNRALRAIPTETDHWVRIGKDAEELPAVVEELGTENFVTRAYAEKVREGEQRRPRVLQLHAAYYTGTIDTVPHVPDRCFVGAGWSIIGGPWIVDVPLETARWVPSPDLPPRLQGRVFTTRLSQDFSTGGPGRRVNLPTDLTPGAALKLKVTRFSRPDGGERFEGYFFIANGTCVPSAEEVRDKAYDLSSPCAYYAKVQVGSSDCTSPEELASAAGALMNDLLGELMTCVPDWVSVEQGRWPPKSSPGTNPDGGTVRR
jgi:hypothetical protein